MTLSPKDIRRWRRLEEWQREAIREMYKRHLKNCRKHGIEPEPTFIAEVMENMRRGMWV